MNTASRTRPSFRRVFGNTIKSPTFVRSLKMECDLSYMMRHKSAGEINVLASWLRSARTSSSESGSELEFSDTDTDSNASTPGPGDLPSVFYEPITYVDAACVEDAPRKREKVRINKNAVLPVALDFSPLREQPCVVATATESPFSVFRDVSASASNFSSLDLA